MSLRGAQLEREGTRLFQAGRYRLALERFREAQQRVSDSNLLFATCLGSSWGQTICAHGGRPTVEPLVG